MKIDYSAAKQQFNNFYDAVVIDWHTTGLKGSATTEVKFTLETKNLSGTWHLVTFTCTEVTSLCFSHTAKASYTVLSPNGLNVIYDAQNGYGIDFGYFSTDNEDPKDNVLTLEEIAENSPCHVVCKEVSIEVSKL